MNETVDPEYVAIIDQDKVTDEVRDIALKYDPLNRSGKEGFHITDDGELHIDDVFVMKEHKLIEKNIPNDAVEIVPLPSERGQLVHQFGQNGFRLHNLPIPEQGAVTGLLGRNGIGKSTALRVLGGDLIPNLGNPVEDREWDDIVPALRGTELQTHFERVRDNDISVSYKRQRVDRLGSDPSTTVEQFLEGHGGTTERLRKEFMLEQLFDREITDLSGGERQRVSIAATLAVDADLYLLDEPSSFLDIGQRLDAARAIREHVENQDAAAIVVDHDLASLDLLSDSVHVLYGESGGFGIVSQKLSPRDGINQFLEGRLHQENVKLRRKSIEFPDADGRTGSRGTSVFEYPRMEKSFDGFSLAVEGGKIYENEVVGIVGKNALGKTTFAKMLAGTMEPDGEHALREGQVSYKPQYITPDTSGTVRERFADVADVRSRPFKTRIRDRFDIEPIYDRRLEDLSGGELQRVGIALCLAREADLYLLDEPSAFLDVERRVSLAAAIQQTASEVDKPVLVIDHDIFLVDWVANRLLVFEGERGRHGLASRTKPMREGMNEFLSSVGITFRRDGQSGRPRPNDPGSQLDREQREHGEYYYDQ